MSPEEILLTGLAPISRAVDNYGRGQQQLVQVQVEDAMKQREMQQRYQQALAQLAIQHQYATALHQQDAKDQLSRDKAMQEWEMKRQLGVLEEADANRRVAATETRNQNRSDLYATAHSLDPNFAINPNISPDENEAVARKFIAEHGRKNRVSAIVAKRTEIEDLQSQLDKLGGVDPAVIDVNLPTLFTNHLMQDPALAPQLEKLNKIRAKNPGVSFADAAKAVGLGSSLDAFRSYVIESQKGTMSDVDKRAAERLSRQIVQATGDYNRFANVDPEALMQAEQEFSKRTAKAGGASAAPASAGDRMGEFARKLQAAMGGGAAAAPAGVAPDRTAGIVAPTAAVAPRKVNQQFASALPNGLIDGDTAKKLLDSLTPDQRMEAGARVRTEIANTLGIPDITDAYSTPGGEGVTPWTPVQGFKNMVRDTIGRPFAARERGEVLLGLLNDPQKGLQFTQAINSLPPETKDYIYRRAFSTLMTVPQGNQFWKDGAWQHGGFDESAMDIPPVPVPATRPEVGAQWE